MSLHLNPNPSPCRAEPIALPKKLQLLMLVQLMLIGSHCPAAVAGGTGGYLGLEIYDGKVLYTRRYTPAEDAGLLPGDEILAIDAKPVHGLSQEAIGRILEGAEGEQVTISVRRAKKQFAVVMAKRERMPYELPLPGASAEQCYKLGVKQRELGLPNESRLSLMRAISADPNGPYKALAERYILTELPLYPVESQALGLNNQAWNLSRSGQRDKAKATFKQSLDRAPNFEWPRNNLASILGNEGKLAEANAMVDYILNMHPQYVSAWMTRSYLRQDAADMKGALICARKAVQLNPDRKDAVARCEELKAAMKK